MNNSRIKSISKPLVSNKHIDIFDQHQQHSFSAINKISKYSSINQSNKSSSKTEMRRIEDSLQTSQTLKSSNFWNQSLNMSKKINRTIELVDKLVSLNQRPKSRRSTITPARKQVFSTFCHINSVIKYIGDIGLSLQVRIEQERQKALLRIFNNMMVNVSDLFRIWRELASIQYCCRCCCGSSHRRKPNSIINLQKLVQFNQTKKLTKIIEKFKQNRIICQIKRNYILRIVRNKCLKVVKILNQMKNLPKIQQSNLKNNCKLAAM